MNFKIVDRIAEALREIGQPTTDGLFFVIDSFSELDEFPPVTNVLGIPVLIANGVCSPNGNCVILAGSVDKKTQQISKAFDQALRLNHEIYKETTSS